LLDKKGVERDEGTERQEFLIHILTQQPDVIQFTIRALVYTHPELASSINPNNSLEALMITCKEAKERVERIISDALHWFRFQE